MRVPDPESLDRLVIRIATPKVYRIYSWVNAVAAGIVQDVTLRRSEVVCELDLVRHARRYALEPGANTLELKIVPVKGGSAVYSSWVIVPPDDPVDWTGLAGSATTDPAAAAVAASVQVASIDILGVHPVDGRQAIQNGRTLAPRALVRARLQGRRDSISMRIRAFGEDIGDTFYPTAGPDQREGAIVEGGVDLEPGFNRFEIEVRTGTDVIERRQIRVLRQLPGAAETFRGKRWAVIVGVSDYAHNDQISDLQFGARDATAFRDLLVRADGGRFDPERVRLLIDGAATNQAIRSALFSFLADTQPEDLVVVFFAGHGVPDPRNPENHFFMAHDSRVDDLGGSALPMWDVRNLLEFTLRAKRVLVLADACHSGAAIPIVGARSATSFNFFNKYLERLATEEGRMVITASRANEFSFEGPQWGGGHGVFTHSVLTALRGEGDTDGDGLVTAGELFDYIQIAVPQETDGAQNPTFRQEGFNRNFPIAAVPGRTGPGAGGN